MIRVIVRETYVGDAVNIGAPVDVAYKTFIIHDEELENYLNQNRKYTFRTVIGVEIGEAK